MHKENYYIYHSSWACAKSIAQITENLYPAKTVPKTFPIINLMSTTANDTKNIINSLSNQINCVVMIKYQKKQPKVAWITIVLHTVMYDGGLKSSRPRP